MPLKLQGTGPCYVVVCTGPSCGTGKSLAFFLYFKGANLQICARVVFGPLHSVKSKHSVPPSLPSFSKGMSTYRYQLKTIDDSKELITHPGSDYLEMGNQMQLLNTFLWIRNSNKDLGMWERCMFVVIAVLSLMYIYLLSPASWPADYLMEKTEFFSHLLGIWISEAERQLLEKCCWRALCWGSRLHSRIE